MKLLIWLTAILLSIGVGQAQKINGPLAIGDTVPDFYISKIKNYRNGSLQFSELKGKLVLVDFWMAACIGCLHAVPELERLQSKYRDKLQVIMVNPESQENIDSVFRKLKKVSTLYKNADLASIVFDTIIHALFPHRSIPHEVWIDGNGVVKAMTGVNEVTEANIKAMIEKGYAKMDMKMDLLDFQSSKPYFPQLYKLRPDRLTYYSVLLGYIPGIVWGWHNRVIDDAGKTVRVSRVNMTPIELITNAITGDVINPFKSVEFDYGKRVFIELSNPAEYVYDPKQGKSMEEWKRDHAYTYELVLPLNREKDLKDILLSDFRNYFPIKGRIETRKMKCMALVRTSSTDKIKSTTGLVAIDDIRRDPLKYQLWSGSVQWLVNAISRENRESNYCFTDKTGYEGRIDIELEKGVINNIPLLKKELITKYNLDLVEGEYDVPVLVFSEFENK